MESITYVSPRFYPYIGGVETHVAELAARAPTRFRRVSIVTTDPSGSLSPMERLANGSTLFRVRSFAPRENYHFPLSASLVKILRSCRSPVLHLHSIHDAPGPLAGLIEAKSDSTIVFTPHFLGEAKSGLGKLFFEATRPFLERVMDRVDGIICVSDFEAGLLGTAFPDSAKKVRVIPNGVDSELLSQYSWSLPASPRILFVGRLEKYKNVDKILEALAVLKKERPSLKLAIVGRGPFKEQLLVLTKRLGLESSVEWFEGLSKADLYRLYESSSLLVLPSQLECYGIVVAEAVAIGTPAIVTNSSALSEFVTAGLAAPVEPPVEADNLVDAISLVLEDPESFSSKGKRSEMVLSWDDVASKTFETYESLM